MRSTPHNRSNARTREDESMFRLKAAGQPGVQTGTEAEATVQKRSTGHTAHIRRAKMLSSRRLLDEEFWRRASGRRRPRCLRPRGQVPAGKTGEARELLWGGEAGSAAVLEKHSERSARAEEIQTRKKIIKKSAAARGARGVCRSPACESRVRAPPGNRRDWS